jgi:hypothetical protein
VFEEGSGWRKGGGRLREGRRGGLGKGGGNYTTTDSCRGTCESQALS